MANVLILSRRNATVEWQYIADRLTFADSVRIISGFDGDGDLNYMPTFYQTYYEQDMSVVALDVFGESTCREIIQRCRLLRNRKPDFAMKLIGATWFSLNEIVEQESPDIVVSSLVDFFVADVLQRIIEKRGRRFVGIARSILKQRVILSARGEFNSVHPASEAEIESATQQILAPTFAPSVNRQAKYNFFRYIKTQSRWRLRWLWFDWLRLTEKNPLHPEYLITPKPGDDYYVSFKDWYKIEHFLDRNWQDYLSGTVFDRRVFIGLQFNPECTTDYWITDPQMAKWLDSLEAIVKVLGEHQFTMFVKDHPVMYGLRKADVFERLRHYPHICFVPYEVSSQQLIDCCKTVFTWTGTIAIQAALAGRCPVITNSYYANEQDFVRIPTMDDITMLPQMINDFRPPADVHAIARRIVRKICESSVPGQIQLTGFSSKKPAHSCGANMLADSLNRHLPHLLAKQKPTAQESSNHAHLHEEKVEQET